LALRRIVFEPPKPLPGEYKGLKLDPGYPIDLLVPGCVVVEVKAVEVLQPLREARLLTHLKLGARKLGLRINFNVAVLKKRIRRRILGVTLWALCVSVVRNYVAHRPYASRLLLVGRVREEEEEEDACRESDYAGVTAACLAVPSTGSG
jgi:GxxExxY protein